MNLTSTVCTMIRSRLGSGNMGIYVSINVEPPFSSGGELALGFFEFG